LAFGVLEMLPDRRLRGLVPNADGLISSRVATWHADRRTPERFHHHEQANGAVVTSRPIRILAVMETKVFSRPLHCLCDRLGVAVVVLVPFEERLHVLRRDQAHVVSEPLYLAAT